MFGFLKDLHEDKRGQGFAGVIIGSVLSVVIGAIFIAIGQNIVNVMGLSSGNVNTAFSLLGIVLILVPLVGLVLIARSISR